MFASLRKHWPAYLKEAVCLGIFMISAGVFTALLESPDSPVSTAASSAGIRVNHRPRPVSSWLLNQP